MSDIFYIECKDNFSQNARELIEKLIEETKFELKGEIPIKVHFGEKGSVTYVNPKHYDGIIDLLEENQVNSSFIETNVVYLGARTTKKDHSKVAKDHGFTRLPIIFADGEAGEKFSKIQINKEFFKEAYIGEEYENYPKIIVAAHFKGHAMAGFGGAIKQLAMGFASRGGKLMQHSSNIPVINTEKCTACGACADNCPQSCIDVNEFAVIDGDKCIGCAGCIPSCPISVINVDWSANTNFHEKVAEYAYAAQKDKEFIYINYVINVTNNCDCHGEVQEVIMPDIGIYASKDPVALDKACADIVKSKQPSYKEADMWSYFDKGFITLNHAEKINLGSNDYKLIKLK